MEVAHRMEEKAAGSCFRGIGTDLEALGDLIVGTNGHSIQCESIPETSLCVSPVKTEFLGVIYWSNLSHMPSAGVGKAEHFE